MPSKHRTWLEAYRLAALCIAALSACEGTTDGMLQLVAYSKSVVADDGYELTALDLQRSGEARNGQPRAWMFYIVGSEPVAVRDSTAQYADLVAQGIRVVLVQPRGVKPNGSIDRSVFWEYDTRQRRVADQASVLDAYLTQLQAGTAVLLAGTSEGGVIAAELAARDARVTHLIMLASGGGWTQA
jgi:pimeloyl-ACP methyl ester carboxylesterase